MGHEKFDREEDLVGPSNRSFGVSVGAIVAAIGSVGLYLDREWGTWSILGGAGMVLVGIVLPVALSRLNRAWMKLGLMLFHIVNPLVMLLMYGSTIIPIGLLMRAMGKDPLRLRPNSRVNTYWIKREPPGPPPPTMKNQF